MRRGAAQIGSLFAALLLAGLTAGVFWVLQDYGPESALRKFHRAAVNRNYRELTQLVAPNSYEDSLNRLYYMVDTFARSGAQYQLLYVKRENKRVVAEVAYAWPNRKLVVPVFWVVEKFPGGWKVNVNQTEAIRQRYGM